MEIYIYFLKDPKILIVPTTCQVLMDGWKLVMSTCCYGYSCNGVA
jgi:hypothetical protein